MRKDYKTIREVVGPLMLVDQVQGATYDELVEIHQENGEVRSGRVLVIDGDKALVQLFESSQGLRPATAKARFLGHGIQLGVSPDMLGRVFDGMGRPIDGGASPLFRKSSWISTGTHEPRRPGLSFRNLSKPGSAPLTG